MWKDCHEIICIVEDDVTDSPSDADFLNRCKHTMNLDKKYGRAGLRL